jgi:hypothetical protein
VSNTYCVFCFVCLRAVSCVRNIASFSGLFILDFTFGFLQPFFYILTYKIHLIISLYVDVASKLK